jgi:hypothetical protein
LCIGAAVNYLTGIERRAPQWMQRAGLEWLFRLLQNPRRLAKRYLVRGPFIFLLLWRIELRVRKAAAAPGVGKEVSNPTQPAIIVTNPEQACNL